MRIVYDDDVRLKKQIARGENNWNYLIEDVELQEEFDSAIDKKKEKLLVTGESKVKLKCLKWILYSIEIFKSLGHSVPSGSDVRGYMKVWGKRNHWMSSFGWGLFYFSVHVHNEWILLIKRK